MDCYNIIAKDFDKTRVSVWKKVKEFLDNIPEGSLVGDIGCGNGKNMLYNNNKLNYIGIDSCVKFIEICKNKNLNVILSDILSLPFEDNYFDYIICIAVIHHLDSREKRINAISELIRTCKKNILIYVWSFNIYDKTEKRKFNSKDELVPFITNDGVKINRYYHLYDSNELIEDVIEASKIFGININYHSFVDRNNECIIITK